MKAISRSNRGRAQAPASSRQGPKSGVQTDRRSPPKTESRESKRGTAFLETDRGGALDWDGADAFAGEYLASATGCEAIAESSRDEFVLEEIGGPFVDLPAEDEAEAMRSVRWFGED